MRSLLVEMTDPCTFGYRHSQLLQLFLQTDMLQPTEVIEKQAKKIHVVA
jgi:hypothetical protein